MIWGTALELVDVTPFEARLKAQDPTLTELFAPEELAYCTSKRSGGEALAARHAARVAASRALGVHTPSIELLAGFVVQRAPSGAPSFVLRGAALTLWQQLGAPVLHLSMSHTGGFAVAQVIAERLNLPAQTE
ncbi:MAG: ACP synthase [Myxococcota bacterium]